jgi:hypothetical protein
MTRAGARPARWPWGLLLATVAPAAQAHGDQLVVLLGGHVFVVLATCLAFALRPLRRRAIGGIAGALAGTAAAWGMGYLGLDPRAFLACLYAGPVLGAVAGALVHAGIARMTP